MSHNLPVVLTRDKQASARLTAVAEFRQARRQAALQEILARLTGDSVSLLSFDDVRQRFKISSSSERGLQEIPLDAIVGSVGRYTDFTRTFLPRKNSDQERWARVEAATLDTGGLPPIEVYQIGQVYFVLDGNHRVSVARQFGAGSIQAYVTEFKTKIPLTPDDRPDDLIIKAEYANFLEKTHLDELRPQAELWLTVPGRYWALETHIEARRYLLSQEQNRDIPEAEAVCNWYDNFYLPVVEIIRERGILRDFPGRTETDLYLWIFEHRALLNKRLGWQIEPEVAAASLAAEHSPKPIRIIARMEEKLRQVLRLDHLEAGPTPGQWRQERLAVRPDDRLFAHILVPLRGDEPSWQALDQALIVAQHEDSFLHGLHVVSSAAKKGSQTARSIEAEFKQRCQAAGLEAELSIETGQTVRKICEQAWWADLVVLHSAHPPGLRPLTRLNSGSRAVIHRSSRPVLVTPSPASRLERALLAYDGSPKAQEALFVATYLAGQWQTRLTVLTVIETEGDAEIVAQAQNHLETRQVAATFVSAQGKVAPAILNTAAEHDCDLIIMGGYGSKPVVEVVLGSAVSQVLHKAHCPLLICR